jgi:hypothetical protein
VNAAGEDRLPHSIGGLVGFALRAWAADAPLYLALAAGVLAAYSIAEFALPAAVLTSPPGQFKIFVIQYTGLFADSLVVAAVALGTAARAAGSTPPPRALAGGAVERWLPVIAVTLLSQAIVFLTGDVSGLGASTAPRALVLLMAPLVWILWGILGLTGPLVALGANRSAFSVIVAFGRAFSIALRRGNLVRLCVLAVILMVPTLLQTVLLNALLAQHTARAFYWANVPVDVLTIGPFTAIATAFALDFARRAGLLESPPAS